MKEKFMKSASIFSKAIIQPVMFMAVTGIVLSVCAILKLDFMPQFTKDIGNFIFNILSGGMIGQLSVIFAVGIAAALAKPKYKTDAAILGIVTFMIFLFANNSWLTLTHRLAKAGEFGLYGTGQGTILGLQVVDMGVFLGIMIGCLVGVMVNKFGDIKLHKYLAPYEGTKSVYIILIFVTIVLAIAATKDLFDDLSDINYIFLQLQLTYQTSLVERKSCIVFDEVQLCPKARQAIKALVKDGRYDYIEIGSLISIHKNIKDILIPSEERKIHMYPMDYEEFKWALDDHVSINLIKQFYDEKKPIGQGLHRKLLRDFKLYMLVGGMPQAVSTYIETNDLSKVDLVKRDILTLYEDDFRKIDPLGRISALFDAIPAQLMGNASRYKVSSVLSGTRPSQILEQIAELKDSGTVNVAYNVNHPGVGMAQLKDLEKFKLFTADTGLFITLAFKDKQFTENDIYTRILNDKLQTNLGYVYENMVA